MKRKLSLEHSEENPEENQYLDLVKKILNEKEERANRTGITTLSIFGALMRFDLQQHFPLLTTKLVGFRLVAEELLWFIRGDTNANHLSEKKVHIWDGNSSREFLDKRGLTHYEPGDCGPIYGWQWRHFGAVYTNMNADYSGKGVDQLKNIIHTIKTNPTSRQMYLTAWNPCDIDKMVLPPCHVGVLFEVRDNRLYSFLTQRSCDMGLGVPFNIASYSLLTMMIAHVCDLEPGEFVHGLIDAHVYSNHIDGLKQQIGRECYPFPTLRIVRKVTDIDDFRISDFEVVDYVHHPAIKLEMAV